jgi:hypothetical protein
MTLSMPPHGVRLRGVAWPGWLAAVAIILAGCGGTTDGGGGGGGNGAYDAVIPLIQRDFGSSMVGATVEGDTLKITLVNGAGVAMAKLFMCANVRPRLKDAGLENTKVVIVEQSGTQLATEAVCKP